MNVRLAEYYLVKIGRCIWNVDTNLRTESADFLTDASLSPIMEAIFGSAFVGSQAAIPNFRKRLSNSSKVP